MIQGESFDFVAKGVADARRILSHAIMLQVLHDSLLLKWNRFELLLEEFVLLCKEKVSKTIITYLNNKFGLPFPFYAEIETF